MEPVKRGGEWAAVERVDAQVRSYETTRSMTLKE